MLFLSGFVLFMAGYVSVMNPWLLPSGEGKKMRLVLTLIFFGVGAGLMLGSRFILKYIGLM